MIEREAASATDESRRPKRSAPSAAAESLDPVLLWHNALLLSFCLACYSCCCCSKENGRREGDCLTLLGKEVPGLHCLSHSSRWVKVRSGSVCSRRSPRGAAATAVLIRCSRRAVVAGSSRQGRVVCDSRRNEQKAKKEGREKKRRSLDRSREKRRQKSREASRH